MGLVDRVVGAKFFCTSRARADAMIRDEAARMVALVAEAGPEGASRGVGVPAMLGVDEEMREWSLYQILEHDVIVNRVITGIVKALAGGLAYKSKMDPKRDVMPSSNPGGEQVEAFVLSVDAHLETVKGLLKLRGTLKHKHPVFGMLDAHGWHCMFGLHLQIHRKQAETVVALLREG